MGCVMWKTISLFVIALFSTASQAADHQALVQQVRAAEQAFAATMATRDFKAFTHFVSTEAVFFDGDTATHGREAIAQEWKAYFDGAQAPFSWQPQTIEVLASGTLAHSSGPVLGKEGQRVATFNSVWRLEEDGQWRVIFDKGCSACNCRKAT
jgi:ketosteroid isomerase-like protein